MEASNLPLVELMDRSASCWGAVSTLHHGPCWCWPGCMQEAPLKTVSIKPCHYLASVIHVAAGCTEH